MNCPECGRRGVVMQTFNKAGGVVRRRKCSQGHIFKTLESLIKTNRKEKES